MPDIYGNPQTGEARACLAALQAILDGYGFTLGHEDSHGAFQLIHGKANDEMRDWLAQATEQWSEETHNAGQ